MPLISVEEFLEKYPEHTEDDSKSLMKARIDHEYSEREAQEQQRQVLLKKKQALIAENKKRKDDLASLDRDLEKFIDVSLALHVLNFGDVADTTPARQRSPYRRRWRRNTDGFPVAYTRQAAKPIQRTLDSEY